jgi:beta-1,4-mannosyl-glycoprotein beta-1,4-N-acetylglucosaminyltransferase
MRKVIDAFMFFNELDMLDFHLHSMDNSVDYFIIGESKQTYSGHEKELYFNLNRARFNKFADKIIYIEIPATSHNDAKGSWHIERFQRNYLQNAIDQVPNLQANDLILLSDPDEVVDENTLKKVRETGLEGLHIFEQDQYFYNLQHRFIRKFCCTRICDSAQTKQFELFNLRFNMRSKIIRPGGWHFSYFSNQQGILTKIKNLSHQDLNIPRIANEEHINKAIQNGVELYGFVNKKDPDKYKMEKITIEENTYLPPHYEMLIGCEDWELAQPSYKT